jgi:LCP family protein required for cell wall assembly
MNDVLVLQPVQNPVGEPHRHVCLIRKVGDLPHPIPADQQGLGDKSRLTAQSWRGPSRSGAAGTLFGVHHDPGKFDVRIAVPVDDADPCLTQDPPCILSRLRGNDDNRKFTRLRTGLLGEQPCRASVDPTTGDAALVSIPRNTVRYPMPEPLASTWLRHCTDYPEILAVYTCATQPATRAAFEAIYPEVRDPGIRATKEVLTALLGIPIDHYAMVEMAGFVAMVDALGGVTLNVVRPIRIADIRLEPGVQHLSGIEALSYARFRTGTTDFDRTQRQRCLLGALAREADPARLLLAFPQLADAIVDHVRTDIPIDRVPELIGMLDVVDFDRLVTLGLGPPAYQGAGGAARLEPIQAAVHQAIADPDAALAERPAARTLAQAC